MASRRITVDVSSPSTELYIDADMVSQNQAGNYSTVYYWAGATNTGDYSSYSGTNGSQIVTIAGNQLGGHTGTIPSGVAGGAQRWYEGPGSTNLTHDAAGNRGADTIVQSLRGWWNRDDYGSIGPYPRIPKVPSAPGKPTISKITPTSVVVSFSGSGDNGGSAIDNYLVRYWVGKAVTGTYTDNVQNNTSRTITGLKPGTTYTFGVYAHNGLGFSALSAQTTITTIAPVHVKVAGVWKLAVPYVKVNGVWKVAQPFVKVNGAWKQTS